MDATAEGLIRLLRAHVEQVEATLEDLARLDAFNVRLAMDQHDGHWRRQALELRARMSVLF